MDATGALHPRPCYYAEPTQAKTSIVKLAEQIQPTTFKNY